jgi:hypothetical protein
MEEYQSIMMYGKLCLDLNESLESIDKYKARFVAKRFSQ